MKMIIINPVQGGEILIRVDQILSAAKPAEVEKELVLSMVTGERIKIKHTMRELQIKLHNAESV